ncbi:MAG: glycosyltransferase family 4 protein [Patescibacteria group bacterium]
MRVLILNYEFPPLGGGAANATYFLLKEFTRKNDLQIDLVTSSIAEYREEKPSDNITVYYLDINKQGDRHYQSNANLLSYSWQAYWFSKKLIEENKYDLVHAFFGIPSGYLAMKLGLPYIVSLRGSDVPFYNSRFYWLDKLFFRWLSRRIWQRAKAVVANSQGLKELALRTAPKQKMEVVYNGVEVGLFQSVPKTKNSKFTILYVGRLIARKGVNYLIEAFAKLNQQNDCQLLIVGGGNLEATLRKQVVDLDQDQSVKFFGAVSHDQLPEIYRQSDVYVLPSVNEGMSNTLLEAMASGLPVVVTNTGGTDELVRDNGIIVKQGDTKAIFEALQSLKNSEVERSDMSIKSLAIVNKFGWPEVAKRYLELYV